MKQSWVIIVASLMVVSLQGCVSVLDKPAPSFTREDVLGHPINLSDFRGKAAVILVFYDKYD